MEQLKNIRLLLVGTDPESNTDRIYSVSAEQEELRTAVQSILNLPEGIGAVPVRVGSIQASHVQLEAIHEVKARLAAYVTEEKTPQQAAASGKKAAPPPTPETSPLKEPAKP